MNMKLVFNDNGQTKKIFLTRIKPKSMKTIWHIAACRVIAMNLQKSDIGKLS